jgi:hypothetical protein
VTMPTAGGGPGGGACADVVGLHADKATTAARAASVFKTNPMARTPAFALEDVNFPYIAALRNRRKRTKMLSAFRRGFAERSDESLGRENPPVPSWPGLSRPSTSACASQVSETSA